jgi:competence protein ComEC
MNKRPSAFIFLFCILGALFAFYNQHTIIFYLTALFICIISILIIKLSTIRTILFLCFCFLLSSINSKIYQQNYFQKIEDIQKQKNIIYNGIIKNIKIKEDASKTALINAYEQKNPNNSLNLIINFYDSASGLDLRAGDVIVFKAKINLLRQSLSAVHFNAIKYGLANNIHGKITIKDSALVHKITTQKASLSIKFQENLRINLLKYLSIKEASLLLALMIGDTSLLDEEQTEIFKAIGAQHLLAVSGLQVSLLSFFLYLLLSWLLALVFPIKFIHNSKPLASIICLCFIWFFVAICGFPRSAARAAFMSSILLLPNLFIRKIDIFDAFYASGFISVLLNPACVLDLGFLLSYAAVFGLIVANQSSKKLLELLKEYSFVLFYSVNLFLSCLAAYLATLPILAICFGQTSVLSILSNFFLLPIATLCQSIAILLGFLGNIFNSSILLNMASSLALSIEIIAEFLSNYFSLNVFFSYS